MPNNCRECGDHINPRRAALGYTTCLVCGDKQARQTRWCTAPINKSNYMLITNHAELAQLNPKKVG